MRYVKRFIRIPQKTENTVDYYNYLLGAGIVFNFGLLFKMRENHREQNLKNEIRDEIYRKYKL